MQLTLAESLYVAMAAADTLQVAKTVLEPDAVNEALELDDATQSTLEDEDLILEYVIDTVAAHPTEPPLESNREPSKTELAEQETLAVDDFNVEALAAVVATPETEADESS